ncbi:MAG: SRPBCC family protein [Rhodospirillaceae bacterium]
MPPTHDFRCAHDIVIDAPAEAIFDYVTNPNSWPEWIAASHEVTGPDRPLTTADTFREQWSSRTGPVTLDWIITACEHPRLWIGETGASFLGPIVVRYDIEPADGGHRFTRTVHNPARPQPITDAMRAAVDAEAATALANIKRNVEARPRRDVDTRP